MTNFIRKSFSVGMGNSKISDENWERTFGRKVQKVLDQCNHVWVLTGESGPDSYVCVNCAERTDNPTVGVIQPKPPADGGTVSKHAIAVSGVWVITEDLPGELPKHAKDQLAEAAQLRRDADRVWEKGDDYSKRESSRLHAVAGEIEAKAKATKPLHSTLIRVLVEVAGEWRCIQTHTVPAIDMTISHCTNVAGLEKAPKYEF